MLDQGSNSELPVIPAKRTHLAQYNPWWTVLKDCDVMASSHEDKLGLTPRRRGQVTPAKVLPFNSTSMSAKTGRAPS